MRVNALLLLAIASSAHFFVLGRPFIVTLVIAAVMAGMANETRRAHL